MIVHIYVACKNTFNSLSFLRKKIWLFLAKFFLFFLLGLNILFKKNLLPSVCQTHIKFHCIGLTKHRNMFYMATSIFKFSHLPQSLRQLLITVIAIKYTKKNLLHICNLGN